MRDMSVRGCALAVLAACVCVLACCGVVFAPAPKAHADDAAAASAEAFDYDGDAVDFFDVNGATFGMYRRQEGSWVEYRDGAIVVEHITGNTTIYAGFYLDADIHDRTTWDAERFKPRNEGGWLSFELDDGYAGKAWPIAPVKVSDETATTSKQYYIGVPPLEQIPGYVLTVTFTDGLGNTLLESTVNWGEDAQPPADPKRDGFDFKGWDAPLTGITKDTVINATWAEAGTKTYTVTFVDGWGATLKTQQVKEGEAAQAPSDPAHKGFTFAGWDPEAFDEITEDLTVSATWHSDDDVALEYVKGAIQALPGDARELLGDEGNEAVADAATAYEALSPELQSQLGDDERLRLAQCAIAVLPQDPYDIGVEHKAVVKRAQAIFESLPSNVQDELDTAKVMSSRTYGRYLENAVWALDALRSVNNATLLGSGTYSGQVTSTFDKGKSDSRRKNVFTVTSVIVKAGRATAVIEQNSNTSESLRMGGVTYPNLGGASENSRFEIPINLSSTSAFHFCVMGKGATADTVANAYEMTVSADLGTMKPDAKTDESASSDGSSSGSAATPTSGDGKQSGSSDDKESQSGDEKSHDSGKKTQGDGKKPQGASGGNSGSSSGSAASAKSPASASPSSGTTRPATRTSSSGNLSSLLRPNGANQSSSAASSKASASSSAASPSSKSQGASGASADARDVDVEEVVLASGGGFDGEDDDLRPAIAGGMLLSVSLGMLAFVLRFVRREAAFR